MAVGSPVVWPRGPRAAPTQDTRSRSPKQRRYGNESVSGEAPRHAEQPAYHHLKQLVDEGCLTEAGQTRNKTYRLASLERLAFEYSLDESLTEDRVWSRNVMPALQQLPTNVLGLWHYKFTTDPNHSGEGIFFASRMFDKYAIV